MNRTNRSELIYSSHHRTFCALSYYAQVSFTFGVLGLCLTEAIALCRPDQFWVWYMVMMIYLLSLRIYMYRRSNMHYFLIDFCYFTCVACMIAIFVAKPLSVDTFQTVFALANGPVLGAFIVWRNSLVFHSIDKITTVYIHCLPSLLMWCWRWHGLSQINSIGDIVSFGKERIVVIEAVPEMRAWNWIGLPLVAYICWQGLYLLKTEYWDREKLNSNPSLQTSLRWIAHNEKMASHRVSLRIMRNLGFMEKNEKFDPYSLKTKLVRMAFLFVASVELPMLL